MDNDFRLATNMSVDAHCFSRSGGQSHEDTNVPRLGASVLELASLEVSHSSRILSSSEKISPKEKNFVAFLFISAFKAFAFVNSGWQVLWLGQALEVI